MNDFEYTRMLEIMGREPNSLELGIFEVMWSEHCSYKSSKKWIKTLPTKGSKVIHGPGENAGVVDIGDGLAAVFKMESHNHPSFIDPYQGAATGIGGILRDIFTMGARPIASLNSLRFGDASHPRTKELLAGVVSGIGSYGNCVGVPTVGGEINFDAGYNDNILVNAMTIGIVPKDKIFTSKASGVDNLVVYVGAKTGYEGINGATMSSAEFNSSSAIDNNVLQICDPFTEKLLIESCLEIMDAGIPIAVQDMGAAGLTSACFEMASRGKVGMVLNLEQVPCCEDNMSSYEIMLSETQERMVLIINPDKETQARAIFKKWDLDFSIIGKLTDNNRMILKMHGKIVGDIPIEHLIQDAPEYDRDWTLPLGSEDIDPFDIEPCEDSGLALLSMLSLPDICSRRWIWEQYDYMVMTDTVGQPGGDSAVVRIHGTHRALALTSDCTPRYCKDDPRRGGAQAVAEAWRNLISVGAKPLAITNCLNFGNPERPEVMGQLVGCIEGIGEACRVLEFPVVSGNVSLYNETDGRGIPPTPVIGGVGLIDDLDKRIDIAFKEAGEILLLIGKTYGHLGSSLYLRDLLGQSGGSAPRVELFEERKCGDLIYMLIEKGYITACHDISDGGLAVAVVEMAMAGNLMIKVLHLAILM